ncbi:MAG: hypothetical protein ACI9EW_003098 [Cellvibrionaceae bacterium]|jgi:hypothetical protein
MEKPSEPLSFTGEIGAMFIAFLLIPVAIIDFFYLLVDSAENFGVFIRSAEYYRFSS